MVFGRGCSAAAGAELADAANRIPAERPDFRGIYTICGSARIVFLRLGLVNFPPKQDLGPRPDLSGVAATLDSLLGRLESLANQCSAPRQADSGNDLILIRK